MVQRKSRPWSSTDLFKRQISIPNWLTSVDFRLVDPILPFFFINNHIFFPNSISFTKSASLPPQKQILVVSPTHCTGHGGVATLSTWAGAAQATGRRDRGWRGRRGWRGWRGWRSGCSGRSVGGMEFLEGLDDLLLNFVFFFHVYYPVVRKRFGSRGIHIPYELWGASYYVLNLLYPGTK